MSDWISVKDRFPPDCESVLIYSNGMTPISACLIYEKSGSPLLYQINDWDESEETLLLRDVSHWMPLPEPPVQPRRKEIIMDEDGRVKEIR